jgi:hypothetical protein
MRSSIYFFVSFSSDPSFFSNALFKAPIPILPTILPIPAPKLLAFLFRFSIEAFSAAFLLSSLSL